MLETTHPQLTSHPDASGSVALSGIEAIIRSPLGEVRVWIEPDADGGQVRTSIRFDYDDGLAGGVTQDALTRVATHLEATIRRLGPTPRATLSASPVARWLAERVDAAPAHRTPASDLYRDFLNWCDANGVQNAPSQKAFGAALSDRGYRPAGLGRGGLAYRGGLRLKPGPVAVAVAGPLAEAV